MTTRAIETKADIRIQQKQRGGISKQVIVFGVIALALLSNVIFSLEYFRAHTPDFDFDASNDSSYEAGVDVPRRAMYSGDSSSTTMSSNSNNNDWFNAERWSANRAINHSCVYMEDICFASQHLFYNRDNRTQQNAIPHQPMYAFHFGRRLGENAYPLSVSIDDRPPPMQCHYSSIPNHMIMNGAYTDMLGEFFLRVFRPFLRLFNFILQNVMVDDDGDQHQQDDVDKESQFFAQTQLYLSLSLANKPSKLELLDSHQLLMGMFSTNPVLPLKQLFDNTQCRCAKRLIACGYTPKRPAQQVIPNRKLLSGAAYSLDAKPFGYDNDRHFNMTEDRAFLLERGIHSNPYIQTTIQKKRVHFLRAKRALPSKPKDDADDANSIDDSNNTDDTDDQVDTQDWKIIGLTQRTGRRNWINHGDVLEACNKNKQLRASKIICVQVKLEHPTMGSPVQHLATHASLDGLIGIHGAQLTEALFMKPNSLVVELLPWVLRGLRQGDWTKWAHRPTPLGVLFSETDLQHIGYPLDQSTASHIDCPKGKSLMVCFQKSHTRWDERTFSVDPKIIVDILQKFVVTPQPSSCEDFQDRAGDEYVLYNVHCLPTNTNNAPANASEVEPSGQQHVGNRRVRHYYRPSSWVDERAGSGKEVGEQIV